MMSINGVFAVFLFLSSTIDFNVGLIAENKQFPYAALIYNTTTTNHINDRYCSGTIISDKFVLTAALCIEGARKYRIKLGAINVGNATDYKLKYEYDHVMDAIPALRKYVKNRDVAVILLSPKCTFSSDIKAASLPSPSQFEDTYKKAIVAGWDGISENQLALQFLPVRVLDDCSSINPEIDVDATMCAVRDEIDSKRSNICRNLGSSLFDHSNTLIGIALQPCDYGKPQAFARIAWYTDWILSADFYYSVNMFQ